MSSIWVVFGATGQQGGAVARALLQDATLAKSISIRAAVRNLSNPAGVTLQDLGCETVRVDLEDKDSLHGALRGASGIFLVTANNLDDRSYDKEIRQGKNLADAAMEAGVQNVIFSTLPSVRKVTNNRLTKVVHFDAKYDIEQYIRQLPLASCFVALGAFMQNFDTFLRPQDVGDGSFAIRTSMPSSTVLPLVDATDIGQAVVQIVKDFDKFRGRTVNLSAQLNTLDDIAAMIGKANAKPVKYIRISSEEFLAPLPQPAAEDWAEFAPYMAEYGYFGADTITAPTGEFGQLTTFEDFLRENIKLGG